MKDLLLRLVATDRKYSDIAILFLRLLLGGMMLTHGWSKMISFVTLSTVFPDPLGIGSQLSLGLVLFAEIGCSLLLILGCLTRLAILPLMFDMIVVLFMIDTTATFYQKELPLLYLGMSIVLLWTGAYRYSLDTMIRKKLIRSEMIE
ncbi:MAG: DoxX family protein [Odoribacter sp.]